MGNLSEYVEDITGSKLPEATKEVSETPVVDVTDLLVKSNSAADELHAKLSALYEASPKKHYYDALVYLESIMNLLN